MPVASASVSTRPSSIAEKKRRSPFASTFWMARTWCWPPTLTTTGCAAKMKGESWSGSLPTRRAYSRAAGSALISRTSRRSGSASVTTILTSLGTRWSILNTLTGQRLRSSVSTAASWRNRPVGQHQRAAEVEPVAGRAAEERHRRRARAAAR